MEEKKSLISNNCNFASVRPAIMELPYPPVQVKNKNKNYAELLSIDYCGAVSELSTIAQYINNENRMSCENCSAAKIILSIAMAEMIHLQKLGELICLLGGNVDYVAKYQNGQQKMWTPSYISIPENMKKMIWTDIEGEKKAIQQYRMHIKMIQDSNVNEVLARIIKDEEYHIMMLHSLLEEL
ncbi:MAG: ferritin family protein [Wujia sp.]